MNRSPTEMLLSFTAPTMVCLLLCVTQTWAEPIEGYRFLLPEIDAEPGSEVTITVQGEYEMSAQGFALAARYPADQLRIDRIHADDTILESLNFDFIENKISTEDGYFVVGVLVDTRPPFDGLLIPNIGFALDLFHMEVSISPEAQGDLRITLENGLSTPPVVNLFTVDNQSVPVSELGQGVVHVTGTGNNLESGPKFIRGDANGSGIVDIVDPIMILDHVFLGKEAPACMQAADANDDDAVDISDSISLLGFLFSNGTTPCPPWPIPGPDPTPGELTCSH